jgi:hypothetical protein
MKKILSIFVACVFCAPSLSMGAVTVKKAAPVATKKAEPMDSATSLLPTVIGLVGDVKALKAQQEQLSADCIPTGDDLNTVNNLVKEWAKIGETDATSMVSGLGGPCGPSGKNNADSMYANSMQYLEGNDSCYVEFDTDSDKGMVWQNFPRATYAKICNGSDTKNCKHVSNIYDVFGKISFSDEDFVKSEASKVAKLKEKMEKCAPHKINAAKRELFGGFLTKTLGNVGQSSGAAGTSAVLEAVSSMGGSGNLQSILPSLGQMATQTLEK